LYNFELCKSRRRGNLALPVDSYATPESQTQSEAQTVQACAVDGTDLTTMQRNNVTWPDDADIRTELARIAGSPCFARSPQLMRFLRFVVDAVLTGKGHQIKGYTVATDALGRDARFDPQADPIVRVQAGRLRRALAHYYANSGRGDPIVIDLPRGSYVPVFRAKTAPLGSATLGFATLGSETLGSETLGSATLGAVPLPGGGNWMRAMLRENYRLLLLVVAVSIVAGLGTDLLETVLTRAIWPQTRMASQVALPASAPPVASGRLTR
jgi:hypothetical protein